MTWPTKLSFSLILLFTSSAAPRELKLKNIDSLDIDQFGFSYIAIDEKLSKYDKELKVIASFSEPLFGDIAKVDATNALNPVLWFGETYRVAILDNRLNQSQSINLLDQGFYDPKLISVSDDRHLWVYDQSEDKIIRFSTETNKRTNQSLNISQILGEENEPIQMHSSFEKIYLNVPEKGILIFDALGAFEKLVAVKNIEHFEIYKGLIYFQKEKTINMLNKQGKSEIVAKDLTDCKSFDIFENKIFLISSLGVEIRTLN